MIDQLIISGVSSYDDFEASVKERQNIRPKKKSIKETVPFSNITHDFSAINGEIYWEERTLKYVFEITAANPEDLEEKTQLFTSWVMNVFNEEIHDPFIFDYHFMGTFDDIDVDDAEIEKSTITVTFTAYPYMIANRPKSYEFSFTAAGESREIEIRNNSSHRIVPTVISDMAITIKNGSSSFSIPAGEVTDDTLMLAVGNNKLTVTATAAGKLTFSFREEVF